MSEEGFHLFLGAMCATALFVFIALYFIKAGLWNVPYGIMGIFH